MLPREFILNMRPIFSSPGSFLKLPQGKRLPLVKIGRLQPFQQRLWCQSWRSKSLLHRVSLILFNFSHFFFRIFLILLLAFYHCYIMNSLLLSWFLLSFFCSQSVAFALLSPLDEKNCNCSFFFLFFFFFDCM